MNQVYLGELSSQFFCVIARNSLDFTRVILFSVQRHFLIAVWESIMWHAYFFSSFDSALFGVEDSNDLFMKLPVKLLSTRNSMLQ